MPVRTTWHPVRVSRSRHRAVLATTHPVPSYGGMQFGRDTMVAIADAVRTNGVPMHLNHDYTRPVAVTVLDSGVAERDDGHYEAWALLDLDDEIWASWQAEVAAAGAPGGMSFTITQPLDDPDEVIGGYVAGDAAHFSDEELRAAAAALSPVEPVHARRLYQFSSVPDAIAVIALSLQVAQQLGPSLLSSALWDGVKVLCQSKLRLGRRTRVTLETWGETGQRSARVIVDPVDESSLRTAMELAPNVILAMRGSFTYDNEAQIYRKISE